MSTPGEVTQLLIDWRNGDEMALDRLMPIVYRELHQLAENRLRRERPDHTLQATELVNEAYLRLIDWNRINWQNRAHFLAVATQIMRNILVDHARRHATSKRGGGIFRLSFNDAVKLPDEPDIDLIALDDALVSLAKVDPLQSRIIELRYFGGLTFEEVAEVLEVSPAKVSREWNHARAWLFREISKQ